MARNCAERRQDPWEPHLGAAPWDLPDAANRRDAGQMNPVRQPDVDPRDAEHLEPA